jgi:uncharacterized SAM-binding protein YcdF (DUF218 family)
MSIWAFGKAVSDWLLPPGLLVISGFAGLWLLRKRPRTGKWLLAGSFAALWALSTPMLSGSLLRSLEPAPLDLKASTPAQAIVVLGGGRYRNAPEYGVDTVSQSSLERVRFAAALHRATSAPVLTSGGAPDGGAVTEAQAMKAVLENEFNTPVQWLEGVSRNTLDQALATRRILAPLNVKRIYLVTHAWHMQRSVAVYARAGFDVVPAPMGFKTHGETTLLDFMPHGERMRDSYFFFHEIVGLAWYRIRFLFSN